MANCNNNCNCKKDEKIPQKVQDDFAYVCMSRTLNKLIAIVIVCICLLFASNAAWLYCWMQYDYSSETEEYIYQQDGEGTNIIGDSNEVNNGAESYYQEEETDTNP